VQHSSVYTIGKRGKDEDFKGSVHDLHATGTEVVAVPRGGETTWHGPGQVVAYPLIGLRGLGLGARSYVEALEDAMIRTVGQYGISARVRRRDI
jgi:lipoate-protein ligase B